MRLIAWPLMALLMTGVALHAQAGLAVDVKPVVEGKATAGGEYTLKLQFTVPAGYHAYHKHNPGYGVSPIVNWTELAGLEPVKQTWPEPHKRFYPELDVTEWEYDGTFEIGYTFKVPPGASGTLKLAGNHTTQFCDAEGCYITEGPLAVTIDVEGGAPAAPADPEPPAPTATASAAFDGPVTAGGTATLKLTFTLPPTFHAYHKDNATVGGYGVPPQVTFDELAGLTLESEAWPEAKKVRYEDDWHELEYAGSFTLTYEFKVPADAAGTNTLSGSYKLQICDEHGCYDDAGKFSAALKIEAAAPAEDRARKDAHGFYLDFDYAFELAKQTGKPLLVDFNGKNCVPCRIMEKRVFTLPEVKKLFDNYVIVSVQNDINDARYNKLWQDYRPSEGAGVPYYAVLNDDGEVVRGIGATLPAEQKSHEFISFLKGEKVSAPAAGMLEPKPVAPAKPADWPSGLPAPQDSLYWVYTDRDGKKVSEKVFDFEARFSADEVQPGGEVSLEIRFKLHTGSSGPFNLYHPQSPSFDGTNTLLLELVGAGGLEPLGEWQFPEWYVLPAEKSVFEAEEWKYYGDVVITRNFRVPADAANGKTFTVSGTLAGQWCNLSTCVWFMDMKGTPFGWRAALTTSADGALKAVTEPSMDTGGAENYKPPGGAEAGGTTPSTGGGSLEQQLQEKGLIIMLLLIFGLGMLTLLTPCVLPVLPLTISFFVKQAEQGRSSLVAALIYCACIVGTFTLFGFITSILLGPSGAQLVSTNGYVNIGIGVLFMVLALSFFGAFELEAPAFVRSWISRKQMGAQKQGRGYVTALLSGGSFSIISFSCTGPIAAAILAGAAGAGGGGEGLYGQWLPLLAMLAFSAGLALPIFVLGQFPGLMKRLPKSGGWMNALKVTFAFIEVAIAIRYFAWADIYFSSGIYPAVFTREVVDAVWIACSIGAGLYLLGLFRMPHDHEPVERLGTTRTLIAVSALAFGTWMLVGSIHEKPMGLIDGFLPPRVHEQVLDFSEDLEGALAQSRETGKPVFIDFTGEICANCRWVETNIFPKSEVKSRLTKDFILVHQWTDRRGEGGDEARENYEKYSAGGAGVPMYVVVDGNGTMVEKFVPPQFINSLTAEEFASFLDRAKARFQAGG